jgi:DNA polymerase-3 subunit beta
MKFTCDRSVLLNEISLAQEIISSKMAISIWSNIYMEADNDTLLIKATDMKVNFETRIPVTVLEPGSTTVFGDKFFGIINSIPEGELEFDQKDRITIRTSVKKYHAQLKSISSEKFPEFPQPVSGFFDIPIKDFKEMITQTVFAVSDDETRFFMNGVYFEKSGGKIIMVATDGRRLAYVSKEAPSNIDDFTGVIIPTKILNIVVKRSGDEGSVSISVMDRIIYINFGSYKFSSVLLDGQFPNYSKVIPENQSSFVTVNRGEILGALRRVSLMVEQKSHRVYLNLSSGLLGVYSEESDIGTAREDIPCQYDGEEVDIALNYRYIEDPCKAMNSDEVCIRFTNPNKAITVQPVPESDFFHIVMPMQV